MTSVVAAKNPKQFKGIALLYPAYVLFDNNHEQYGSKDAIADTTNLMGLTVGRAYYADTWDYDVYEEITKYDGDAVILWGTGDGLVPREYVERADEKFPNSSLTILEGEGHGFSHNAQQTSARQLLDMIQSHDMK